MLVGNPLDFQACHCATAGRGDRNDGAFHSRDLNDVSGLSRYVSLAKMSMVRSGTVEDFATFIRDDTARYAHLIRALGDVIE